RRGLGYAFKEPLYVTAIDPEKNRVMAGSARELLMRKFEAKNVNILYNMHTKEFMGKVKVRYRQKAEPARIKYRGDMAEIEFKKSVASITPGQTAVFYKNDTVIGSGIIEKITG
ncbi:MAG TPA: tRNA 2-thiouridine(34) synthase MnmA, partial [Firmicutes bacterium]|nr:tRNA 2-thiouridine(34) synthase MnmA [Bacillota bacterium]